VPSCHHILKIVGRTRTSGCRAGFATSQGRAGLPRLSDAFAPANPWLAIKDYSIDGARATCRGQRLFEIIDAPAAWATEFDDNHGWTQPRREATYRWFTLVKTGRTMEMSPPFK
jgi:hypothetical protein